jgi:tetratricopeptide (TPR) repeat protein
VVAVAVVYLAMSIADGGYPPEAIAAGTLLIWWAVIVGLAVGAWPRGDIPRAAIVCGLCIFGFGLLTALSLGWASDDGRAFIEVVRVAGYAGLFTLVVLASPAASARTWLVGLAIGLVAVSALALGSRFEPSFPGGDQQVAEALRQARDRLSYPIGYWNGLGACMALGTVLLVWLGVQGRTRRGRAVAIGALPALLLTIYLTSSRGGAASAAVGLAVLWALGPARVRLAGNALLGCAGGAALIGLTGLRPPLVDQPGLPVAVYAGDEILLATLILCMGTGLVRYLADAPLKQLRMPRLATRIALVAIAFVGLAGIAAANPVERFREFKSAPDSGAEIGESYVTGHLANSSGSGRYQFWSTALDAFSHDPITGIGAGGYEAWWAEHGSISRTVRDAHSLFFETVGELGVLGLLLIVSFLGLGALYGWRRRGTSPNGSVEVALALLAAGVLAAALEWTWELPAAFAPVVVAVALLTGPATLRRSGDPAGDGGGARSVPRRSFGWGVATLLVGWVAVWIAGLLFLTEVKLDDSRAEVDRGDLPSAAQDASDASTLQPWAAEPRLQLALVEERAGNLPAARREIGEAIDRAPDDWSLWYVASRIEESAGDSEAADASYERARSLNPRAPIFTRDGGGRRREGGAERGESGNGTATPLSSHGFQIPW